MSDLKTHFYKKPLLTLIALGSLSLAGCESIHTHHEPDKPMPVIKGDVCDGSVVATRKPPRYSGKAMRTHQEGWVLSHVTYDASGKVTDVGIVASSPEGFFEQHTWNAVMEWTFKPSEAGGSCGLLIEYKFR